MIGQSEKSGIEIESGYQLTGHPVCIRKIKYIIGRIFQKFAWFGVAYIIEIDGFPKGKGGKNVI